MTTEIKRLYNDEMPRSLRLRRLMWGLAYHTLFRPTPRFALDKWRLFILRLFGARIGKGSRVAPTCFVWAPWNLTMGNYACLADGVDCYTIGPLTMGDYTTVSQRTFLCTASHDIRRMSRPLFARPIVIEDHAWVAAEAFIGPGVTIGQGAVVGARAAIVRDVDAWHIMVGNPARSVGVREILENSQ